MTIEQDIQGLLDEQGAYDENRELLKKIIRCVQVGRLRINGLPPDQRYSLAEYLFDDEYCLIDTSRLSPAAKARFHQWLIAPHQKDKIQLYHGSATTSEYRGYTAQSFLSWWGRIKSWLLKRKPDYWPLAELNLTLNYQLLGLEVTQGQNAYLIGFNQLRVPKQIGKYKPPHDDQQEPMGNVKRLYLSDSLVDLLAKSPPVPIELDKPHPHSVKVEDYSYRYQTMRDHRLLNKFLRLKHWFWRLLDRVYVLIDSIWSTKPSAPDAFSQTARPKSDKTSPDLIQIEAGDHYVINFRQSDGHIMLMEDCQSLETLVFSGGGGKIFADVGVWKGFQDAGLKPTRFTGSSAGAIMALLCYLGYNPDEIQDFFHDIKRENLVYNEYDRKGLSNNNALKSHLESKISEKVMHIVTRYQLPNPPEIISFEYLAFLKKNYPDCGLGDELLVTATNIQQQKTTFFGTRENAHVEVSAAVAASASLPVVFKPALINLQPWIDGEPIQSYSDGGVMNNLATDAHHDDQSSLLESEYGNNLKLVAIQFDNGTERSTIDRMMDTIYRENWLVNWLYGILTGIKDPVSAWVRDRWKLRHHALQTIIVPVGKISTTQFSVDEPDQAYLMQQGYEATMEYISHRYQGIVAKPEGEGHPVSIAGIEFTSRFSVPDKAAVKNTELMYSTFSGLDELMSFCCYRGQEVWFERVVKLIEHPLIQGKNRLHRLAERLRQIYFRPQERALPPIGPLFRSQTVSAANLEFVRAFLMIHPLLHQVKDVWFCSKKQRDLFYHARHHNTKQDPYHCLDDFERLQQQSCHIFIYLLIHCVQTMKNKGSKAMAGRIDILKQVFRQQVFSREKALIGDWQDLSERQINRLLNCLEKGEFHHFVSLCDSYQRGMEPLQSVVHGVFVESEFCDSMPGIT